MGIISFKEFMKEMAVETGKMSDNYLSFENDWVKHYKSSSDKKMLMKDIGSNHYIIYRVGNSHIILADHEDNYLGYIELTKIRDHQYKIGASNSKLQGGFYNIIFTSLLSLPEYKEIFSDTQLSTQAINSYLKLNNNPRLHVQVVNNHMEYSDFSKTNLLKDEFNRVSVTAKNVKHLEETFKDYYKKIYSTDICMFKNEFNNHSRNIDIHLFCEGFDL